MARLGSGAVGAAHTDIKPNLSGIRVRLDFRSLHHVLLDNLGGHGRGLAWAGLRLGPSSVQNSWPDSSLDSCTRAGPGWPGCTDLQLGTWRRRVAIGAPVVQEGRDARLRIGGGGLRMARGARGARGTRHTCTRTARVSTCHVSVLQLRAREAVQRTFGLQLSNTEYH